MFEQMKVYHVNYKEGIIIKCENGIYFIDFNGEVKKVSSGNWLKSLFINKLDAYKKKESINLSSYETILAYDNSMKISNHKLKNIRLMKGRRDRSIENFWIEDTEQCPKDKNILSNEHVIINEKKNIDEEVNLDEAENLDDNYSMYKDTDEPRGYFSEYYPGHQDYEMDDIVYEAYIEDPWDISSFDEKIHQTVDEGFESDIMQNKIFLMNKEKFILNHAMIVREEERCIVVILTELMKLNNKNYFKVIGIDVRTAKIVTIVDTNGKEKGLLSYNFNQFIGKTVVIKAKFECLEYSDRQNVLRIVSNFSVVSNFIIDNLKDLNWKYHILSSGKLGFISDFAVVKALSKEFIDKPFHILVNFTGTRVKKNRNNQTEFCIKMGDSVYPVIKDNSFLNIDIQDKYYRGIALITWRKNKYGEIKFFAEKMYGKVLNSEEIEMIKSRISDKSEVDYLENELDYRFNYKTYLNSSFSLQEDSHYFDEYLDRNVYYFEEDEIEEEENMIEVHNQEHAYWFSDDEYVEGNGYDEDF